MNVELKFITPVLGTLSGDPKVATEFILSKNPNNTKDEAECLPDEESLEKSSTVFPKTKDGQPFIWDYQFKGFFKSACEAMITSGKYTKEELKKHRLTMYLYKKTIDKLIFVFDRRILFKLPAKIDPANLDFLERPLRGETMRGERICLARSEVVPAGATVRFEIETLNEKLTPFIKEWLDYGRLMGMLQWRSGGMGRFTWKKVK